MKRFLSLALAATMCLSLLAGCGSKDSAPETDDGSDGENADVTLNVAAVSTSP